MCFINTHIPDNVSQIQVYLFSNVVVFSHPTSERLANYTLTLGLHVPIP